MKTHVLGVIEIPPTFSPCVVFLTSKDVGVDSLYPVHENALNAINSHAPLEKAVFLSSWRRVLDYQTIQK